MATDVSTALPDVSLQPGHTVTVTLDDPLGRITKLNVFALNLATGQVEEIPNVQPLLAYVPQEAAA
jgi:hypothetical protein